MTMVTKGYRVMLQPNNVQQTRLSATADAARYAYNWTVAQQMESIEKTGKYISERNIRKMFTLHKREPGKKWLYNVSNDAAKQAIRDACQAFWRFEEERKKPGYKPYSDKQIAKAAKEGRNLTRYEMHSHPNFKKKGQVTPGFYVDTDKIEIADRHVKLEAIATSKRHNRRRANWIRLAEKDRIPVGAKYVNPRINYDGLNWWIGVGVAQDIEPVETTDEVLGNDFGLKEHVVRSDGVRVQNINKTKTVKALKKKKRRLQRSISRKYRMNNAEGEYNKTKNIIKAERQLIKYEQQLTGIRSNHRHHVTADAIKQKPRCIVGESLKVSNLMKNKHLAEALAEVGIAESLRQLKYKSERAGIEYIEADPFFPSSKLCSGCGTRKTDLKLKDRTYVCINESCGLIIDRDLNAALNLKKYGENNSSNHTVR